MRLTTPAALALLALAPGCGAPVSLDDPPTSTEGPVTGLTLDSFDGTTDEADDTLDTSTASKLDIAAPSDLPHHPLPPGVCPPDCQFELTLDWTYDGPAGPAPEPEDRVLALVNEAGGTALAEQRQGAITVVMIDIFGRDQWTQPVTLPCDPCHLESLSWDTSTGLLLAGHGDDGAGSTLAFVARVELLGPSISWTNAVPLQSGPGITPRAGPLVLLPGGLMTQPALEASAIPDQEQLELIVYDGRTGALAYTDTIATGAATSSVTPRAAYGSDGVIAVSRPLMDGPDPTGALLWIEVIGGTVLFEDPLPAPTLELARAAEDRIVALGQSPMPGQATLHLHGSDPQQGLVWGTTYVQPTDSTPVPAMAVGQGHTYVATRIATGAPGRESQTSIQLLRWSEEGELFWQVAIPVTTDGVDRPLGLQVQNSEDQELVLAAFVQGARHVEQRRQTCICD